MDDNQVGHTCKCPNTCDEILKDSKFQVSSKGQELYDDYDIENNNNIEMQFSNKKVCATNGIGYESECEMRIAACNQKQNLDVAKMGDCGKLHLKIFQLVFFDIS